jgi:restriction system protein
MIQIGRPIEIICGKCHTKNIIETSELGEPETDTENRSMGEETEYEWLYEFDCSKCNNHIHLNIRAFEYPTGFLNFTDNDCKGGDFDSIPDITLDVE